MAEIIQVDLMEKMTFDLALEEWRQHGQADMKKENSKLREDHEKNPRFTNSEYSWGKMRTVQEFVIKYA